MMRSVRFDSELPNVVCEIPFFMGVSQPRTFQARKTSDVTVLALSKFDYEEVMCIYPEQNDIIVSNVLSFFQLDKDGNDVSMARRPDAEPSNLAEDSKEKLRCATAFLSLVLLLETQLGAMPGLSWQLLISNGAAHGLLHLRSMNCR